MVRSAQQLGKRPRHDEEDDRNLQQGAAGASSQPQLGQHEAQSRPEDERARKLAAAIQTKKALSKIARQEDVLYREREMRRRRLNPQLGQHEAQSRPEAEQSRPPELQCTGEHVDEFTNRRLAPIVQRVEALSERAHLSFQHRAELRREREIQLRDLNEHIAWINQLEARVRLLLARERLQAFFRDVDGYYYGHVMTSNLTEDSISSYLKNRVSENRLADEEQICTICLDYLCKDPMNIATLDCRHEYHFSCIKQWLQRKNVCPLCNKIAIPIDSKIDR
ncbi:putative E3 ubiquitin-protein ligase rhb1a [Castilleja foliolosa]|uniref:RING-type E3 ubiquitin transferase n=1 Tax=Castilleja foliolosa TaxID=1961234 RepID=A0ABD3BLQ1_9LAMI